MKSRILGWAALAIIPVLVASSAAVELRAAKPTTTISGVVKSYEVYRGKVRTVYIKDAEHGEFLIVRGTEKGKELLNQVGASVKATGYARPSVREPEFPFVFDVVEYEIIAPPAVRPVKPEPGAGGEKSDAPTPLD